MQYDAVNSGLAIKTTVNFRKFLKLLLVHDPTNQPDCSFMQSVEIPLDLSICGDETLALVTPGPLALDLEFGIDADKTFTNAELLAMITINNHCVIRSFELSLIDTVTPSTAGAPWASWITINSGNDMVIEFNANVNANVTYNLTLWFTSTGGVVQKK